MKYQGCRAQPRSRGGWSGGLGEGCNTSGIKLRTTMMVTAKLRLLWFHSRSVSEYRGGSRNARGPRRTEDSSLDRDTRQLLWEESAGITQGRVLGPGLHVALCSVGQSQLHCLVPCKGGWRNHLAGCQEGRTWVWRAGGPI